MRLRFTKHAGQSLKERGISVDNVLTTISNPSALYLDLRTGVLVALRTIGIKQLVVAYVRRDDDVDVVTTLKTSAGEQVARRRVERALWLRIR